MSGRREGDLDEGDSVAQGRAVYAGGFGHGETIGQNRPAVRDGKYFLVYGPRRAK